ncbi:MAG: DegT/DnrJ/EryC1/StrS family aminotransferase [Candidatus Odinarchaeia archaeon]
MIPISAPVIGEEELNNIVKVLNSGIIASGEWVRQFENEFACYIGVKHAISTVNGTTALDIALKTIKIKPGDEVIVPDFTFIATANAVLFQYAKPVFADIDDKTYTLNPDDVVEKISNKTKAVIGVHLFGHPFNIDAIREICEDHHLFLIEDCAQAHGAEYKGEKVGKFGEINCFSLYATKNMTTGEGGMLTTNDDKLADRVRLLINHGQTAKYVHEELGFNYRLTNLQAALGLAQLKKLDKFNNTRIKNARYLNKNIRVSGIDKPVVNNNVRHVYHQYVIKVLDEFPLSRNEFLEYLNNKKIGCSIHYPLPIHMQPLYKKLKINAKCPIAEEVSSKILSLPVHPKLTGQDLKYICDTINSI